MELKDKLKQLLDENNMKLTELSKATGIALTTLSNWSAGQNPKNIHQLKKLADYFEMTVDELMFGDSKPVEPIENYREEINAGIFKVVLIPIKKRNI